MKCEICPFGNICPALDVASTDNYMSYHPQNTVRVEWYDCPLAKIVDPDKFEEVK